MSEFISKRTETSFFQVISSCTTQPAVFNFHNKIHKKGKNFYTMQRTISFSVVVLSGSFFKQLWYLQHCYNHNLIWYWIKELTGREYFVTNQVLLLIHTTRLRMQKGCISLLKAKSKGFYLQLITLKFPSTYLQKLVLLWSVGLFNSYCMYVSEQLTKALGTLDRSTENKLFQMSVHQQISINSINVLN